MFSVSSINCLTARCLLLLPRNAHSLTCQYHRTKLKVAAWGMGWGLTYNIKKAEVLEHSNIASSFFPLLIPTGNKFSFKSTIESPSDARPHWISVCCRMNCYNWHILYPGWLCVFLRRSLHREQRPSFAGTLVSQSHSTLFAEADSSTTT